VAIFSAPSPTTKTWSVFSMTRRARLTGFLTSFRRPAAPAMRVLPSIMEASISTRLSMVKVEPSPALKTGLSSMLRTAASTASRAVPPDINTSNPALAAALTPANPGFRLSGCHAPAPPCTRMVGFCMVGSLDSFVGF